MSEHTGREQAFGLSIEAIRGTAETTVQKWVRKVSSSIQPKNERKIDDTNFGRLEDGIRVRSVKEWYEGDLDGILHADVIGYLFANIYGACDSQAVAGAGSEAYDHVFTLDQTLTHPTLTMFVKDGDVRQAKVAGAVIKNLELNIATDDYIRFKASFTGKQEAVDASSPSYDEEYDFIGKEVEIKIADTEEALAAATAIKLKNLTLSWDCGLLDDWKLGNVHDIYNGKMSIEGSFEKNYDDQTFENMFKGITEKYMQIKITGVADLDTVPNHPTITLLLNRIMVTDWSRSDNANDLVTESVKFKALYNEDDTQQSELTLRNLTSEYIVAGS